MPRTTTKKPTTAKTTAPAAVPNVVDQMLATVAQAEALRFYTELPGAIQREIERIATAPTAEEVAAITQAFNESYPTIRPWLNAAIARVNESRLVLIQGGADNEAS